MNASYDWLRAFVPVMVSPAKLRDIITASCTPVDELVSLREDLRDVVVGRVVEARRHPESDHLWLTKVDSGMGELAEVVCGAPNVKAGKSYPFAPAGSTLPGGLKLERRKIMGVVSNGMLCSARELGLGQDQDGILELDTEAPPGTPFLAAMPVGDTRLVVDVSPNRPDLLSHVGLAREIAAATDLQWSLPVLPGVSDSALPPAVRGADHAGRVAVSLQDTDGCPRYMGAVIRGVRVGPSPDWLAERLVSVGARPINNIVDVTNHMLSEVGQPMHAFDVAALAGPAIVVRTARPGEKITTLDGVARALEPWMTVIADRDRAQAIAGVMGAADSQVGDATTDIFLEVATFNPSRTRRTRRALNLSTDASYRFERGTDIDGPPLALERALKLIMSVAGGTLDQMPTDLYPEPRALVVLTVRVSRVARLLGDHVPSDDIAALLRSVGFSVTASGGVSADTLDVIVPSWRHDIVDEVDLVEEVARLRGYESFSNELRPFRPGTVPDAPLAAATRRVREALVARGLLEARPMPFVRGGESGFVRVANPLAESEAYLRRDLLDSLSRRAEYNLSHMQGTVRLFEIGSAFEPSGAGPPTTDYRLPTTENRIHEECRVAALIMGDRRPRHWTDAGPPQTDKWDAKALALDMARVVAPAGGDEVQLLPGMEEVLWEVWIGGSRRGHVRRLALDAPVWAAPAFGVEIVMGVMDSAPVSAHTPGDMERSRGPAFRYRPLPSTPPAEFDLALLVPDNVAAAQVESCLRAAAGDILEELTLFDEYRSDELPSGFRSLAWRLVFRHPERTLREKEIAMRRDKILRALEGDLGVRQRTA